MDFDAAVAERLTGLVLAFGMGCMAWTGFRLMQIAFEYGNADFALAPARLVVRAVENAVHFIGVKLFPERYVQALLDGGDKSAKFFDKLIYRSMVALFLEQKQPGGENDQRFAVSDRFHQLEHFHYTGDIHACEADCTCMQLYNLFVEVKRLSLDVRRGFELRRFAAREIFGHETKQLMVKIEPLWQKVIHEAFVRCTFIPDQVKDLLRQQHEQSRNDRD